MAHLVQELRLEEPGEVEDKAEDDYRNDVA